MLVSGQMIMDTVIPSGTGEYPSIVERANHSLESSHILTYFVDVPVSYLYDLLVR